MRMGFGKCDFSGSNTKKYIEYSVDFVIGVLSQPRLLKHNSTAGVKKITKK